MTWHWVDYIIILIIGLSVLTGLFRGFIKELVALCIWALAIWLAYNYCEALEITLQPYISDDTVRKSVSFLVLLLGTLITGGLFNALLGFILKRSGLSGTDRMLGMGFGLVRGIFIIALGMLIVRMTSIPYEEYNHQSKLYAQFDPVVNWMSGYVPDFINKMKSYDIGDEKNHDIDITILSDDVLKKPQEQAV